MVGGKFFGIVRGLGNERLFVTNLALYVVDLWNEKNMGVFQLQPPNVQHQTTYPNLLTYALS